MNSIKVGSDERGPYAKVGAGVSYLMLMNELKKDCQYAMNNLPSLTTLNMVGNMVTSSHGSNVNCQTLANKILEFKMVMADGSVKQMKKGIDQGFSMLLINYGLIGIITEITIELQPAFMVQKCIFNNLNWDVLFAEGNLKKICFDQDYLTFFTNWKERSMYQVWSSRQFRLDH
jgi:xylitol oxidase